MAFLTTSAAVVLQRNCKATICSRRTADTATRARRRPITTACATAPSPTTPTQEAYETGILISETGELAPEVGASVVGVFAILDTAGAVRHVGISRDVATSLARCLVRQPTVAHSYRLQRFRRPSRAALEEVRAAWAAHATDPATEWDAINVLSDTRVSAAAMERIEASEPGPERARAQKAACREVQKIVEEELAGRGLTQRIKFAPKLKDKGILDVESVKIAVPDTI